MRKWMASLVLLLGLLLPMGAMADVEINDTNFPDANFRKYVLNLLGKNLNDTVSETKFNTVTQIKCSNKSIASLKGIEFFTALETLDCNSNDLTELDVRENTALKALDCNYNQLTELDIRKNTALKTLECYSNKLTELDVRKNTALTELNCSSNSLTSIDVSQNTALKTLKCGWNGLTVLDVSKNIELIELYCWSNQLTELDVRKNTALKTLDCMWNGLTELDVSKNTALTKLDCSANSLTSIDVSQNTALTGLYCDGNELTRLDVSANTALTDLYCGTNKLTRLDVSANTKLKGLNCYNNQLTELNVSRNTELEGLYCYNNQLTELNVSQNTKLKELRCSENQLACANVNSAQFRYLSADKNIHPIFVSQGGVFDLSTLKGFDVDKASNWQGGTVSGNILTVDNGKDTVTYTYDCGNGKSETFTLNATTANVVVDDLKALYMTNDLKAKGIQSVQQIKDRMQEAIKREYKDFAEANRVYSDVSYGAMIGGMWQNAPLPQGGLEILLPFPEGTDPKTHDYLVTHMIARGANAGQVEKPDFKVEDQGIRVQLTSLSPVCIAWKVNQATQNTAQDLPKTGDNANLTLWLVLLGGCGAALALVMRKRKT